MKKLFLLSALICGLGQATPFVTLHTNQGDILLELDEDNAPATVANFLHYVNSGFYDDTVFHRVIKGFMIQGGGYDANLTLKPTQEPIANEAHNGLKNQRGTIAMARTNDPHSATSQFFINLTDNNFLDATASNPYGYAVFGNVIDGMETVDTIANIPTAGKGPFAADVPKQTVTIIGIDVMESLDTADEPTSSKQSVN